MGCLKYFEDRSLVKTLARLFHLLCQAIEVNKAGIQSCWSSESQCSHHSSQHSIGMGGPLLFTSTTPLLVYGTDKRPSRLSVAAPFQSHFTSLQKHSSSLFLLLLTLSISTVHFFCHCYTSLTLRVLNKRTSHSKMPSDLHPSDPQSQPLLPSLTPPSSQFISGPPKTILHTHFVRPYQICKREIKTFLSSYAYLILIHHTPLIHITCTS